MFSRRSKGSNVSKMRSRKLEETESSSAPYSNSLFSISSQSHQHQLSGIEEETMSELQRSTSSNNFSRSTSGWPKSSLGFSDLSLSDIQSGSSFQDTKRQRLDGWQAVVGSSSDDFQVLEGEMPYPSSLDLKKGVSWTAEGTVAYGYTRSGQLILWSPDRLLSEDNDTVVLVLPVTDQEDGWIYVQSSSSDVQVPEVNVLSISSSGRIRFWNKESLGGNEGFREVGNASIEIQQNLQSSKIVKCVRQRRAGGPYVAVAVSDGSLIIIKADTTGLRSARIPATTGSSSISTARKIASWIYNTTAAGADDDKDARQEVISIDAIQPPPAEDGVVRMNAVVLTRSHLFFYEMEHSSGPRWCVSLPQLLDPHVKAMEVFMVNFETMFLLYAVPEGNERCRFELRKVELLAEGPKLCDSFFLELDFHPVLASSSSSPANMEDYLDVDIVLLNSSRVAIIWKKLREVQASFVRFTAEGESSHGHLADFDHTTCDMVIGNAPFHDVSDPALGLIRRCSVDDRCSVLKVIPTCWNSESFLSHSMSSLASRTAAARRPSSTAVNAISSSSLPEFSPESTEECIQYLRKQWSSKAFDKKFVTSKENTCSVLRASIVELDRMIVDAKPVTGIHWGASKQQQSEMDHVFTVTPQLVRFQLEEKLVNHESFVEFLRNHPDRIWEAAGLSCKLSILEHGEKLQAALALCVLQSQCRNANSESKNASSSQYRIEGDLIVKAMQVVVGHRGYSIDYLRNAGLTTCDIFYSEVSRVDELMPELHAEMVRRSSSGSTPAAITEAACVESGVAMHSILEAALQYRKNVFEKHPGSTEQCAVPWTSCADVRASMLSQVEHSARVMGYIEGDNHKTIQLTVSPKLVEELANHIVKLGEILLQGYANEEVMNPASLNEGDYEKAKGAVFNPLIALNSFEKVLSVMCKKYKYYLGMIECCLLLDENVSSRGPDATPGESQLRSYCVESVEAAEDGGAMFAKTLFRHYASELVNPWAGRHTSENTKLRIGSLLALPKSVSTELHSFLQQSSLSQYAWVNALTMDDYGFPSINMRQIAYFEKDSLNVTELYLSIGKLCGRAANEDNTGSEVYLAGDEVYNAELHFTNIQKQILSIVPMEPDSSMHRGAQSPIVLLSIIYDVMANDNDMELRVQLVLAALRILEELIRMENYKITYSDTKKVSEMLLTAYKNFIMADFELWKELGQQMYSEGGLTGNIESRLEEEVQKTLLFKALVKYQLGVISPRPCPFTGNAILSYSMIHELETQDLGNLASILQKTVQFAINKAERNARDTVNDDAP